MVIEIGGIPAFGDKGHVRNIVGREKIIADFRRNKYEA